jgi:hypothetical protein
MSRPELEVADIFRQYGGSYEQQRGGKIPSSHRKVIGAITSCRTARLGGHADTCENCGYTRISYNSCRDRHCPKCQFLKKEKWIGDRNKDLLPVQYFHVVFTVPEKLAVLMYRNQRSLYACLLRCAGQTIVELAEDPRYLAAHAGAVCILHTWGQKLGLHPHVHAIVPGGGLSLDRSRWIRCKNGYLLPARVLSKRFRRKLLDRIKQMYREDTLELGGSLEPLQDPDAFQHLIDTLYSVDWVVYLKRSFPAVHNVVEYLARYTHRIAISNYRLVGLKNDRVYFTYRDYADQNRRKVMSLEAVEFIRRFLLHVVPRRFVRIRYVGLLSNRTRARNIELCRELLNVDEEETPEPAENEGYVELLRRLTGVDLAVCPKCDGPMVRSETIRPGRCIRAPCATA